MIIGISGKLESGKDTIGKIIQYLTCIHRKHYTFEEWLDRKENYNSPITSSFIIKKFADKLKDIICLMIGCTREQLEDHEFKNTELGEEWWYYKYHSTSLGGKKQEIRSCHTIVAYPDKRAESLYKENTSKMKYVSFIKLTPRLLLQLMGTECGKNIIHPNIWVNALMSKYIDKDSTKEELITISENYGNKVLNDDWSNIPMIEIKNRLPNYLYKQKSNWIITDMRFPNELDAVKQRDGITIRVHRGSGIHTPKVEDLHPSETALDNAEFDYIIKNSGTIEELIEKVKEILIFKKLINEN